MSRDNDKPTVDFSRYTQSVTAKPEWEPPVPEKQMENRSRKLAISSRVYPEYLLMAYAYMEQVHGVTPQSISHIAYLAICELLNKSRDVVPDVPSADVAIDFLISKGLISASNKENFGAISTAHRLAQEQEVQLAGSSNLKDQYEYWKLRDPEKANEILSKMTQEFDPFAEQENEKQDPSPENSEPETISDSNIAGANFPD